MAADNAITAVHLNMADLKRAALIGPREFQHITGAQPGNVRNTCGYVYVYGCQLARLIYSGGIKYAEALACLCVCITDRATAITVIVAVFIFFETVIT